MASDQSMTQAITQTAAEVAKVAIMGVREAEGPTESRIPVHILPRANGLAMREPTIDRKAQDKYNELINFTTEVRNIFMTNSYNIQESSKKMLNG